MLLECGMQEEVGWSTAKLSYEQVTSSKRQHLQGLLSCVVSILAPSNPNMKIGDVVLPPILQTQTGPAFSSFHIESGGLWETCYIWPLLHLDWMSGFDLLFLHT